MKVIARCFPDTEVTEEVTGVVEYKVESFTHTHHTHGDTYEGDIER